METLNLTGVSELHGTEKLCWEEKVAFSTNVPYSMLRIVNNRTNGIICIGVMDKVLWIGRIWGKHIATYALWRTILKMARNLGCDMVLGAKSDCEAGIRLYRGAKFQENANGDWERKINV